jgi:uncharacterized membrane protein
MRRDRAGSLIAIVLGLAYTTMSYVRYRTFWAGGLDLGVFDQGIWLLSRGMAPEVTVNGRNLFADHLSPALFAFVPLYKVVATPLWLLAAQGVALGLTVLPMRALARHEGFSPAVAAGAVVLSAPLASAALFDFHPATLAVPAVAWTLLEARRGSSRRVTLAALVVLACRAELAWILVGIAVVAHPSVRRRLVLLAPIGLAAGFVVPALLGARGTFTVHYGHLGSSPFDAATHPWRLIGAVLRVDTFTTLGIWLLPVGFLPLVKPRWLLALLVAGAPVLLSQWAGVSLPWFHYGAPMVPLAIGGALHALASARTSSLFAEPKLLLAAGVASLVVASPLSPAAPGSLQLWTVLRPRPDQGYEAAIRRVGPDEAVLADNGPLAHLTHREDAWLWPSPFEPFTPPELGPEVSPERGASIQVVVVQESQRAKAESFGFTVGEVIDGVYVGRRP